MSTISYDLKAIADMAVDELLASPFIAAIPAFGGQLVVSLDQGGIENTITQDLNKIGLNVTVSVNEALVGKPNVLGPYFDSIDLVAIITENVTVNRSSSTNGGNNPTGYSLVAAVCAILHQVTIENVQLFEIVRVARVLNAPEDQNVWNVFFRTQGGLGYARPPIAPVTATTSAGTEPGTVNVTLGCATPGAPIWFTTDGSYPSPLNSSSQMYLPYAIGLETEGGQALLTEGGQVLSLDGAPTVQPLVLPSGTTLCARAWLAGRGPANPPQLNLTL